MEQWPGAGHTQEHLRDHAAADVQRLRLSASPPQKTFTRKKSLVGSLLDLGFNARERAEDRWRKHRDTDSLVLKDTPAEKTRSASGFANGISGGIEFGGTASNQNDIGRGPSGQSGFDVNAVSGLADSHSAPSETADNTNTRHRDGFSSSVSGNLGFGLGTSDQKGLDIGRADWSEMSNRRSAGGESIGFGFDARSPVGTGSFGWELGKRKGDNAFGFGASGSSSFGGSGINSKIKIEGNQVGSSGGPISNDLGGISARIRDSLFDGISESLRYGFEKFGQKGFGNRGSDWSKSSRDSDVSGSVEKSSSSDLKHGERKREAKFDFGDSGSNRFDDIGLSENVIKGDSNARNGDEYSSGISEDSGFNLGSSDQQGFGISGIGGNGESGSGIVGAGYLSPGSDVSGTGENTRSSGSGSSGGRKGAAGLGVGTSGPNEFGETGVSGTEKGSHIPEATPKYSETNTIIGEASTWGKGAYKAFNGRIFSFDSSCAYTFCRHCVESGEDFNIEIKRNNNSDIEKIIVKIDTNDVSIFGDIILVNEER
ncbi:mucin-19-like [Prionailurus viverrinus]|uniref:mucin-19-like n=1 Tax=Prionailurus viverrinus TaxID=61388 RepID=UPI001FF18834|nr:mucin-19-like [Prionailurus viverrinus]